MTLLTSAEATHYLRIKERKLYELAAERTAPCTKVTGRWLFPEAELDRWVLSGLANPSSLAPETPTKGPVCPTGTDLAAAVRAGHADCNIASRSAAAAAGLGWASNLFFGNASIS